MERRGSGMKKIIDSYKQYEHLADYRAPEFMSNASEFHVTLWNLNYNSNTISEITPDGGPLLEEFVKDNGEVFVKEFVKKCHQRQRKCHYKSVTYTQECLLTIPRVVQMRCKSSAFWRSAEGRGAWG